MTKKELKELQDSIVKDLPPNPHGRLLLSQRMGKSRIAINIIKRDKPQSILWVTPFTSLAEEDIPKEFEKWNAKRYLKKLTTITWASLNKITGHYDMIIFDEEQFITTNNIVNFALGKITYNNIISMTGTPTEHEDKLELYGALNLKVIKDYSLNDAVNDGVLSDYNINVVMVPMTDEKVVEAGNKKNRFFTSEKSNYNYLDERVLKTNYSQFAILARLWAIRKSPSKLKVAGYLFKNIQRRRLMFCSTKKIASDMSKHVFHSSTSSKYYDMFKEGIIDNLVLVESGGIGSTYTGIQDLILCQADSNKNGQTGQKLARALLYEKGKKPTIWILCLEGTQDVTYVENTLNSFDRSKVNYIYLKDTSNLDNQLKDKIYGDK